MGIYMEFWKDNKLHRDDGPAVDCRKVGLAHQEYWTEGRLHRIDGPAIAHESLREEWWMDGRRHNDKAPALIVKKKNQLTLMPSPLPPLSEVPQDWTTFPHIDNSSLADYFTLIFGGEYQFNSLGEFGAMPVVMAQHLEAIFPSGQLHWKVDNTRGYMKPTEHEEDQSQTDLLGCYSPSEKMITLFVRAIAECAREIDRENYAEQHGHLAPTAMSLAVMVYLHELGHAIHHLKLGFADDASLGEPMFCEKLAQHFTMTSIQSYGARADEVFYYLERNSHPAYWQWRAAEPADWPKCQALYAQPVPPIPVSKQGILVMPIRNNEALSGIKNGQLLKCFKYGEQLPSNIFDIVPADVLDVVNDISKLF